MPRYKPLDYGQGRFISVQFEHQILAGSFEHALNWVVDHKLNLSVFDPLYKNDAGGAPAYDPRGMLKIVLYAYSRGLISSRDIERSCEQNVVMMALAAGTKPHFTTIASFIRDMGPVAQKLFVDVLLYCDELGLIGKDMFAVDGCKISSNASKEWSGTREDFERKKAKFERSIERLVQKHKAMDEDSGPEAKDDDQTPRPPGMREREEKAIKNLQATAERIGGWLEEHPSDKTGHGDKPVKQSMTDPDSAKMVSSHGVVQGYNGVAAVDAKHQVVVAAEAFGSGSEAGLLQPMVEAIDKNFRALGDDGDATKAVKLTADSGFHSEANMKLLEERGIDGYVADKGMRKRDPTFATAGRHGGKIAGIQGIKTKAKYFKPSDFVFNAKGKLMCPAGEELYIGYRHHVTPNGFHGVAYKAKVTSCRDCGLRAKCLRNPDTKFRQVYKFEGRHASAPGLESATQRMIKKIDGAVGRFLYSQRMGIVEPVFGNIRHALGLDRFTLRGNEKVNVQWKLFAAVHNLFKIHRYGWVGAG